MNSLKPEFPFPYEIRVNKRAKRLNLKISPTRGIQLVVPAFTRHAEALQFLDQHVAWVEKHAHLWQHFVAPVALPATIEFQAYQIVWQIRYEPSSFAKRSRLLEQMDNVLIYTGKEDEVIILQKLREWVALKAADYLSNRIRLRSLECNLPFNDLNFRSQQTLWGSCTRDKNISLNVKLIFLPEKIIDYILVHELVHTQHLNHSARFWRAVENFVPDYKIALKSLRHVDIHVPRWFNV